jgi:hypothetical protein
MAFECLHVCLSPYLIGSLEPRLLALESRYEHGNKIAKELVDGIDMNEIRSDRNACLTFHSVTSWLLLVFVVQIHDRTNPIPLLVDWSSMTTLSLFRHSWSN